MSYQDWKPVVFHSKPKRPQKEPSVKSGPRNPNKPETNYKEDEDGMPVKRTLPKDFGKKMGEARKNKNWTQKELAQRLNCKVSEVQEYEQNKHPNPNRSFARKIEKMLGAPLF